MDTWWLFTRKYSHEITLTVDHSYTGSMKYSSKDFNTHCHDDGIWCANHGGPKSQEMAIWYKGHNFQFPTMTIGCYVEGFNTCRDSVTAAGWESGDLGLEMTLLRYSVRFTWWLFTREYNYYVDLEVWEIYKGNMVYQSKDFNTHCHEDGIWCVTHGDLKSPEVTIWYKGYNYQHNTVSEGSGPATRIPVN
ncbi:hypothetical protein EC957_009929, partial [Mortierella hygrophila]